jgi:putative NADH-flavin reductase
MKVAMIGASGNVGSRVLAALLNGRARGRVRDAASFAPAFHHRLLVREHSFFP